MTERATGHTSALEKTAWEIIKDPIIHAAKICHSLIADLALTGEEETALGWISVPAKANDDRKNKKANPSATDFFSTSTWFVSSENGNRPQSREGRTGPGGERMEAHIHYHRLNEPPEKISIKALSPTSSFELSFIDSLPSPVFRLAYQKDGTNFIFEQNANETRLITDDPGLAKKFDIHDAMTNVTSQLNQIVDTLKTVATGTKRS